MGQAQINVRTRACSRTSIARTRQAALTHNVRGKELKHHSISFQMQKPPLATYLIAFYGSMQTFTLITQRSLFLGLSDNKLISRSEEITSHWSAIKGI